MPISSFREALASRSSLVKRSRRHAALSTRETQALARHTLSEVVAYVRFCRDHDDDPLSPRDERLLGYLQSLSIAPSPSIPVADPKPLLASLRAARSLMKDHDLWLGHNDPKRRAILSTLNKLGFHLPDHSVENDPIESDIADL